MGGKVILGVDTHKEVHAAAILDEVGRLIGTRSFSADNRGAKDMLAWVHRHGEPSVAGVEGTGGYGYRLAVALAGAGIQVFEVNRPDRARRRRNGKSDPADAEAAARAVLAGEARAVPKDREGPVGSLRALVVARRSAVKARTQAFNQVHALLVGSEDAMRKRLGALPDRELAGACARLKPTDGLRMGLRSLGRQWLTLDKEIGALDEGIAEIVQGVAPGLLERRGVGVHSAAQLLMTAGGNPERLKG